ncbi:uncharacterized protein LOC129601494 [Paramacrobiotus metropolitanus]|uniref:uncharacterized protein LOC129601494 n=1 Tax=Paramacrobiotus metropolitanus TaxID=2943436 RepID=UPI0024462D46|nr:uncharacterized protein LOC129601494 [Paramacrobiotus metropolitanus]XP_055356305.1 uncharacterized protein LOC129601494 [Paramacrobiotus metropolitanus]
MQTRKHVVRREQWQHFMRAYATSGSPHGRYSPSSGCTFQICCEKLIMRVGCETATSLPVSTTIPVFSPWTVTTIHAETSDSTVRPHDGIVPKVRRLTEQYRGKLVRGLLATVSKKHQLRSEKSTASSSDESTWKVNGACVEFIGGALYVVFYLLAPIWLLSQARGIINTTGEICQPKHNGLISFAGGTITVDWNGRTFQPSAELLNATDERQLTNRIDRNDSLAIVMRKWCFQLHCSNDMSQLGYCPRMNVTDWTAPALRTRGVEALIVGGFGVYLVFMEIIIVFITLASSKGEIYAVFFLFVPHTAAAVATVVYLIGFYTDWPPIYFVPVEGDSIATRRY